ncbi:MAG: biotin transporter BioY [Methanobacteriaceae archaeon]|nr:biotin transporter BioY [Methanobacteriaceae archaeon]
MYIDLNQIHEIQNSWFQWRTNTNLLNKILMSFLMACFTGLMAQVTIQVPWSPVLITLQTFAVLIAGSLLGKWGGFSQLLYLVLGILGMPWFTNMQSGFNFILGSSGGYIVGFIIAATFLGYLFDNYSNSRKPLNTVILMMIANFICIYIPGLLVLSNFIQTHTGVMPSITNLIIMGVVPFIVGDFIKIALSSSITIATLPKDNN